MYNYKVKNSFKTKNSSLKGKILILSITLAVILLCITAYHTAGSKPLQYKIVKISTGDNLWEITNKYYGPKHNIRKLIHKIRKINNLDNAILQPGQLIKLPVKSNR